MGCGGYDITNTCGDIFYATCTMYQTELPEWSEITGCVTIEKTTKELYENITTIYNSIDVEKLGKKCIDYEVDKKDLNASVVLHIFEKELCEIKNKIDSGANPNSYFCSNLNFYDLIDHSDCDGKPDNWCELMQFLIDKIKELKDEG